MDDMLVGLLTFCVGWSVDLYTCGNAGDWVLLLPNKFIRQNNSHSVVKPVLEERLVPHVRRRS